jgi:hypothetical protein
LTEISYGSGLASEETNAKSFAEKERSRGNAKTSFELPLSIPSEINEYFESIGSAVIQEKQN